LTILSEPCAVQENHQRKFRRESLAWVSAISTRYDENRVGGFTSDLSTSMFDFFFSFFASFFTVLASFFAFFDPLSRLVIASPCTFSVFAATT